MNRNDEETKARVTAAIVDALEQTQRLPNIEAERREFEAWATRSMLCRLNRYPPGYATGSYGDHDYIEPRARLAWAAWMARAFQ